MKNRKYFEELRAKAETYLKSNSAFYESNQLRDFDKTIEELSVHQIELEMQNDELRRVQQEMETVKNKYFDLYELAPVAYLSFDSDMKILEMNFSAANLLGTDKMNAKFKNFNIFIHPSDQDKFYFFKRKLDETSELKSIKLKTSVEADNGQYILAEFRKLNNDAAPNNIEMSKSGGIEAYRAAIFDITQKTISEIKLEQERKRLRLLIDSVPDSIFFKDINHRYLGCNKSFEEFSNVMEHEIIRKDDYRLFPRYLADQTSEWERKMIMENKMQRYQEIINITETDTLLLDTILTPFYDTDGAIIGIIGISRDITLYKKTQDNLQVANEKLKLAQEVAAIYQWDWDLKNNLLRFDAGLNQIIDEEINLKQPENCWSRIIFGDDLTEFLKLCDLLKRKKIPQFIMDIKITGNDKNTMNYRTGAKVTAYDNKGMALHISGFLFAVHSEN